MPLVSLYGAVSRLHFGGLHISSETFLKRVNTGKGPAPAKSVHGAGLWREEEIFDWRPEVQSEFDALGGDPSYDAEIAEFGAIAAASMDRICLAGDWVDEDPRRAEENGSRIPGFGGRDFHHVWNGIDEVLIRRTPVRKGLWRDPRARLSWELRWIDRTGDLYFFAQENDVEAQVLPVGVVPTHLNPTSVENWLYSLNFAARGPNSIGLMFEEFGLHSRTDWAVLSDRSFNPYGLHEDRRGKDASAASTPVRER